MKFVVTTKTQKFLFNTIEEQYQDLLDGLRGSGFSTIDGITFRDEDVLCIQTQEGVEKMHKLVQKETGKKCEECEEEDDDEEDKPLFMTEALSTFLKGFAESLKEDGKKK